MSNRFLTGIDVTGKEVVNVGDASVGTSAPNLTQVTNLIRGINEWKDDVRGTTTANLAITALVNGLSHDGVTYATGDSILLKNNTAGSENGPYIIGAPGTTGVRRSDFDSSAEATKGSTFTVLEGTTKGTGAAQANPITYVLTTQGAINLGTTALTFSVVGGASATAKSAGNGLTETGTTYDVGAGNGIVVDADTVKIDPSIVARKISFDCAATTNPQTFPHNLGTLDINVTLREASSGALVNADVTASSTSTVSVNFGGAPTAGQWRVTVVG